MAGAFGRPEDFFAHSNARMAGQRLLGLNAIRSNPNVIGYSLTGTVDQGMSGEGLWTTFRELKPNTADALFEGFAPLRFCLFVEPLHAYRGTPARFEAVLANEDALAPGEYPVRLQVFGPYAVTDTSPGADRKCVFERTLSITIPDKKDDAELPFVLPVFAGDQPLDFPAGRYRFLASFDRGAAAAGGEAEFYVADPAEQPKVETEVVLWGEDAALKNWLAERGIRHRDFAPTAPTGREVILAGVQPPAPGGSAAFRELVVRIARGSPPATSGDRAVRLPPPDCPPAPPPVETSGRSSTPFRPKSHSTAAAAPRSATVPQGSDPACPVASAGRSNASAKRCSTTVAGVPAAAHGPPSASPIRETTLSSSS